VGRQELFQKRFAAGAMVRHLAGKPVLSLTIALVYKMWDCNMFLSETYSAEKGNYMLKCPWQPSDLNCVK
jgi:hypothetical protein